MLIKISGDAAITIIENKVDCNFVVSNSSALFTWLTLIIEDLKLNVISFLH